jgi:hypothetical protein
MKNNVIKDKIKLKVVNINVTFFLCTLGILGTLSNLGTFKQR